MKTGEKWDSCSNLGVGASVYEVGGRRVCHCNSRDDAALIAALPDLVEALRRIKDRGCQVCTECCQHGSGQCTNLIAADALREAGLA